MATPPRLFTTWLAEKEPFAKALRLFAESGQPRSTFRRLFERLRVQHFVGEAQVARAGGFERLAKTIENSLPATKKMRSGDLGELLATEYLREQTAFDVPVNKLRWKSDRNTAMHGNDVIGVAVAGKRILVAKVESKSRVTASATVVEEAITGLDAHSGRPNPSTLAFITKRLLEGGEDDKAAVFEELQAEGKQRNQNITHIVFLLSGNDPTKWLSSMRAPVTKAIKRMAAAIIVSDHAEFVREFFETNGTEP